MSVLQRLPGIAVVVAWALILILGAIAASVLDSSVRLSEAYEQEQASLSPSPLRLSDLLDSAPTPQNPFRASLDSMKADRELAQRIHAEQQVAGALRRARVLVLTWPVILVLATFATLRWLKVHNAWLRVRSWHGAKLLLLIGAFITVSVALSLLARTSDLSLAGGTFVVASTLVLIVGAALLIRATWNWLTGREVADGVEATAQVAGRFSRRAIVLCLVLGIVVAGGIGAVTIILQPRTYADCVLRGMKHATTATATRVLADACARKFSRGRP